MFQKLLVITIIQNNILASKSYFALIYNGNLVQDICTTKYNRDVTISKGLHIDVKIERARNLNLRNYMRGPSLKKAFYNKSIDSHIYKVIEYV